MLVISKKKCVCCDAKQNAEFGGSMSVKLLLKGNFRCLKGRDPKFALALAVISCRSVWLKSVTSIDEKYERFGGNGKVNVFW